jgi:Zn-dependent protease
MGSLKLGRYFGIGVYVHWTFSLLVVFVLGQNWYHGGWEQALYSVALLCAVFICVVLHEFGHALTARQFGIGTRDITLYPIGGVAQLERMSERPLEEFLIAVAGPAVNVVLAALFLPLAYFVHGGFDLAVSDGGVMANRDFLRDLGLINIGLILFNLLPAFPMDGGRVLRALLAVPLGRLNATEIAAAIGAVFAVLFFVLAFFGVPMLWIASIFLFLAGQQELAYVRRKERARQSRPLDVVPAHSEILDVVPAEPSDLGFSGAIWDARSRVWILWRNGQPIRTVRTE